MAPSDASILHSTLLAVALLIAVAAAYNRYSRPAPAPTKVSVEKDPNYLPDPSPYVGFDLKTARTRDFIYANKTMAHQPMHIDNWIEIDKDYLRDINMKRAVIDEHTERALNSLPENDAAAGELLEILVDYLPKRYPMLFDPLPGRIWNKVTDERYPNVDKLEGVAALKVASRLVQDDFLMGRERPDGQIYFVGGIVAHPCSSILRFGARINKSLFDIHVGVPQFNEKMLLSVERTLERFQPNQPFERSSWEMVDDYNMYHHHIADLGESETLASTLEPKDYLFRTDKQTFRKFPRSQVIIFGVHPILRKLEEFADLPMVPALLATIHEQSSPALMKYKLAHTYQEKMMPYLKQHTQSQIDRGLIIGDENVADFRDLVKTTNPLLPSFSSSNTTRILLLSAFSPELKTRDIQQLFGEWEDDHGGFKIKWSDDESCWIVFQDASVAKRAFLTLLSSPPPALQPTDTHTPKLAPYTGPDVATVLTAVQNRPRSRSMNGGHSRKGSLLGSGGSGVGSVGAGHARNGSYGRASGARASGGSFGQKQMRDMMEGGDGAGENAPPVPAIPGYLVGVPSPSGAEGGENGRTSPLAGVNGHVAADSVEVVATSLAGHTIQE